MQQEWWRLPEVAQIFGGPTQQPIGYTGAGPDGVVQPNRPTQMVHTPSGPVMFHEGEATVQLPNGGVQVVPQKRLQQMEKGGVIPGYKCGGYVRGMATGGVLNPTGDIEQDMRSAGQVINMGSVGSAPAPAPAPAPKITPKLLRPTLKPNEPGTSDAPGTSGAPDAPGTSSTSSTSDTPGSPGSRVTSGIDVIKQYATGTGPMYESIINRAINQNAGVGAAAQGAARQQAAQSGYSPEAVGSYMQVANRDVLGEASKLAGDLAGKSQVMQYGAAQDLVNNSWTAFSNAMAAGDTAGMASAFEGATGEKLDTSFIKQINDLQLDNTRFSNVQSKINAGASFNDVRDDLMAGGASESAALATYNSMREYSTPGITEWNRKASAASDALQNGDYDTYNAWRTENGYSVIDFSKQNAQTYADAAKEVLDIMSALPDGTPASVYEHWGKQWTALKNEEYKLRGLEYAGPQWQEELEDATDPDPDDPNAWMKAIPLLQNVLNWEDDDPDQWAAAMFSLETLPDGSDNEEGAKLLDGAEAGDLDAAKTLANVLAGMRQMMSGKDISEATRGLLKRYGVYDETIDLGASAGDTIDQEKLELARSNAVTAIETDGVYNYEDLDAEIKKYIPEATFKTYLRTFAADYVTAAANGYPPTLSIPEDSELYKVLGDGAAVVDLGARENAHKEDRAIFNGFETYKSRKLTWELAKGSIVRLNGKVYYYAGHTKKDDSLGQTDSTLYWLVDVSTGKRMFVKANGKLSASDIITPTDESKA
jgi:hypothetical protein